MSTMPKNPHSDARSHLEDLIRLAADEVALLRQMLEDAETFLAKLQTLQSAGTGSVSVMRPSSGPFRYANMKVRDAILQFIETSGLPHTRQEIIKEVLEGGVMAGKQPRGGIEASIDFSLDFFLMPPAEKRKKTSRHVKDLKPKLRQVGELIGLAEWPDEKFREAK